MGNPSPNSVTASVLLLVVSQSACFLVDSSWDDADTDGDLTPMDIFEKEAYIANMEDYVSASVPEECRLDNDIDPDGILLAAYLGAEGDWIPQLRVDPYKSYMGNPARFEQGHFAESSYWYSISPDVHGVWDRKDMIEADSRDFAFYAGHGGPGILAQNLQTDPPGGGCDISLHENVRLGRYCGGNAKIVAYSASCVLGINEQICPLPSTPNETTEPFSEPWPDLCWRPLLCTSARSLTNHTLGFIDSPVVSASEQVDWYEAMKSGRNVTRSWFTTHHVDEPSGVSNQPAVLLRDDVSLSTRFATANMANGTGLNANTLDPDLQYIGFGYVASDGSSNILDESGAPFPFGSQAFEEGYCTFGHAISCEYDGLELDSPQMCN